MRQQSPCKSFLHRIGVGGISFFIFVAGFGIWIATLWRYRLVLRDEPLILSVPENIFWIGFALTIISLLGLFFMSKTQDRDIGWSLSKRTRGGPLQWWDVILCVIPGTLMGTVGVALVINAWFDKSPAQAHRAGIVRLYTLPGSKGGKRYFMCVSDWANPKKTLNLNVSEPVFHDYETGKKNTIVTKKGFLGYEWIVRS